MRTVLVHPHGSLSRGSSVHLFPLPARLLLSCLFFLLAIICIPAVVAQDPLNADGAGRTRALSVWDSPAPNTPLKAGDNISIAIDVSAGIRGTFAYSSLGVYLVSATANANLTVVNGPALLAQEPGSTVKHGHWVVPTCLTSGDYNFTLYEASSFNGADYFSILTIPVQVENKGVVDPLCSSPVNPLLAQPQASNPPPTNLVDSSPSSSSSASPSAASASTAADPSATAPPTPGEIITITAGDGEITIALTDLPGTIVIEPSGGAPPETTTLDSSGFITIFKTVAPTATATVTEIISQEVTLTFEETFVSTFTAPGETREFTVTQTLVSTVQLLATQISSPEQAGLLPINSGASYAPMSAISVLMTLSAPMLFYLLRPAFAL